MATRGAVVLAMLLLMASGSEIATAGNWRDDARKAQLTGGDIRRLDRDKLVITDRRFRQVFSPYIAPDMSVFITTDSILNGYHVLLEESVRRLEQANADRLDEILQTVWKNLDSADRGVQGDPALVAAAKRRARIVTGVAIELLDGQTPRTDAPTAAAIHEEAARVAKAEGLHKPRWLGPEGEADLVAIDYSRFKPRGFYTATDRLSGYFRAVSWLQAIPFRVERDEELLAILLLADCLADDRFGGEKGKRQQYAGFFECFREFLGDRDDWDLMTAVDVAKDRSGLDLRTDQLNRLRKTLLKKAARPGEQPQINDQIAYPGVQGPAFRILSAYRTPDAVLFQRTTDPGKFARPFPTGLEMCVAIGSSYAASRIGDPEREEVLKTVEHSTPLFAGKNVYADYLQCLSTLMGDPPAGSPRFMSSDAWKAKSCQTVLASWAQWRHTWVLQSKQTHVWLCVVDGKEPVGFVEPNPAFFGRLRDLADRNARLFANVGGGDDRALAKVAELRDLLRFLEAKLASGDALDFDNENSVDEFFAIETLESIVRSDRPKLNREQTKDYIAKYMPKVKEMLAKARRGEVEKPTRRFYASDGYGGVTKKSLRELWKDLAALADRLRQLAERQLAGEPFTKDDEFFILCQYGRGLAQLMMHTGDAMETPRDDAPRVADVVYNPNVGEYLEVAVGRPRLMYVLYPTAQGEVLCRGAVLPYHEFRSATRLDDREWKALLDSGRAPQAMIDDGTLPLGHGSMLQAMGPEHWLLAGGIGAVIAAAVYVAARRRNRGSIAAADRQRPDGEA